MRRSKSKALMETETEETQTQTQTQTHPDWTTLLSTSIASLRLMMASLSDDDTDAATMQRLRSAMAIGAPPTSLRVAIDQLRIPRRHDLFLDGMDMDDADGDFDAEWLVFKSSLSLSLSLKKSRSNGDLANSEQVILYLHGGGYCMASKKTHRGITWKLAKHSNCKLLAIDYRLAPEHVFPLALHDAISAYSYLTNPPPNSKAKKYDPSKVVIMGDSSGGGLALALCLWIRDKGEQYGLRMPAGAGLLSPWLDLTASTRSYKTNAKWDYLPDRNKGAMLNENRKQYYVKDNSYLTHPLVSPYFATESKEVPLCPLLIQVGELERFRDEILIFATKKFTSTPLQLELFDSMVHVFQMFSTFLPIAELALERMGMFVQKVTRSGFKDFPREYSRFAAHDEHAMSDLTPEEIDAYLFEPPTPLVSKNSSKKGSRELKDNHIDNQKDNQESKKDQGIHMNLLLQ